MDKKVFISFLFFFLGGGFFIQNEQWPRMKRPNIQKKPALLSVPRLRLVISVWLLRLKWNQAIHLYSLIDKKSPPGQTCCSSDHKGVRRITCNQRLIGLWNNMKYRIVSLSLTFERPSRQVFATGIFIDPDSIKTNIITFFPNAQRSWFINENIYSY